MTEKFVASNGWYVEEGTRGDREVFDELGDYVTDIDSQELTVAVAEYASAVALAKRDRELGRERVEGYPDCAVYPYKNGAIRVLDEFTGSALLWLNDGDIEAAAPSAFSAVAAKWFAAQEPPKCKAALNIKGQHFGCEQAEGHGGAHGNTDAGAIWGEAGDES